MGEAQIYLNWMATSGGNIPYNAVVGGFDNASKEPLYIGKSVFLFTQERITIYVSGDVLS